MIKYGHEVLECDCLNDTFINSINFNIYKGLPLVIQVKNTKHIEKKSLRTINDVSKTHNISIKISVIGPYMEETARSEKEKERFFYNTLYEPKELYKIIHEFEKIEKRIDPAWNQYDIIVYLAETIARNIMYDPEYYMMFKKNKPIPLVHGIQDQSDYYDRSLRGVLTRKTVCAGFSIIFKELANRNGIKCRYVSGGGHAWNLIRINGLIHPLDITWKNTKYRKGDFNNIEDISCDIEKFKKTHKPSNPELNENLTRIDAEIVRRAREKTIIRRHYKATTYTITRSDKTRFVVSQIGKYKGMYKYLYSEINQDGTYKLPSIVFSETNLVREIEDEKFERNANYHEFIKSFANTLFSQQNILDSKLNRGTLYIGKCELENGNYVSDVSKIEKESKKVKTFILTNIRSKLRYDGTTVTLVKFNNNNNNGYTYRYFVYVLSPGPTVMEYSIYSNDDYFSIRNNSVANDILSDENLNNSITNGGIIRK